ncbi:hypothetical protein [Vibrio stylophorae]|uniref:hypothetical protein n=1 Tax=Vibrio stylophorae TaxID=659351 RepID=UPI001F2A4581|nr:hypothetical protein [Vibrio stylophorae]
MHLPSSYLVILIAPDIRLVTFCLLLEAKQYPSTTSLSTFVPYPHPLAAFFLCTNAGGCFFHLSTLYPRYLFIVHAKVSIKLSLNGMKLVTNKLFITLDLLADAVMV